jgi:hypothetical protein
MYMMVPKMFRVPFFGACDRRRGELLKVRCDTNFMIPPLSDAVYNTFVECFMTTDDFRLVCHCFIEAIVLSLYLSGHPATEYKWKIKGKVTKVYGFEIW